MNQVKEIEAKIDELANSVIPEEHIESFKRLPLKEKVFGVKFFATLAKDQKIIELCEHAEALL